MAGQPTFQHLQQPQYYPSPAPVRRAPTGPQLSPEQAAGTAPLPGETDEMRRRRLAQKALVLGGEGEVLGEGGTWTGDGGDGSGGAASAGGGDSGGDGTGGGTGGTY